MKQRTATIIDRGDPSRLDESYAVRLQNARRTLRRMYGLLLVTDPLDAGEDVPEGTATPRPTPADEGAGL